MTSGFFQSQLDPNFNIWFSRGNVKFIQCEVERRLQLKYIEHITVEADSVRSMLIETFETWRGPLSLNELLEMVICDFVNDIDTDIQWKSRFNHFDPKTLYFPGTDITREEKVKLKPSFKWEFQMNY